MLLALIVMAIGPASAAENRRYALVIGNSSYYSIPALSSPVNDASDVGGSLAKIGFEVTYGLDLNLREFWSMVQQFAATSRDGSAVVFYYAGHGFQMQSANYLVPVDAALKTRESIPVDNIDLNAVISMLQQEGRPTIILLDACRNSPLPAELRSSARQEGLMELQTGRDVFVAFATSPGKTAGDGIGRNSPFAQALLNHIRRPGLSVSEMMVDLRRDVFAATEGKQVPWDQSSLRQKFYFAPTASLADTIAQRSSSETEQPVEPKKELQDTVIEKEAPPETGAATAEQPPAAGGQDEAPPDEAVTPVVPKTTTTEKQQAEETGQQSATDTAQVQQQREKKPSATAERRRIEAEAARKRRQAAEERQRAERIRNRASSTASAPATSKRNRPNALAYSYSIWKARNTKPGVNRSSTPYGTLVCRVHFSGWEDTENRRCSWQ